MALKTGSPGPWRATFSGNTPNGRNRYADILARQGVPVLHLKSMGALRRHLKHWGLQQKKPGRDIGRRG